MSVVGKSSSYNGSLYRKQPGLFPNVTTETIPVVVHGETMDYMEASSFLKIKPSTLRKYRQECRVAHIELSPRKFVYLKKDLLEFLESHRVDV